MKRLEIIAVSVAALVFSLVANSAFGQTSSATNLDVLRRLAEERYAEGDLERSAALYLEIAGRETTDEDRVEALFAASWLQYLAELEVDALDSLTRALTLRPDHSFDASHYTPEFENLYSNALSQAERQRSRIATETLDDALQALEAGKTDEAESKLRLALENDPSNPVTLYNLATIEMQKDRSEIALPSFEKVVSLTYQEEGEEMTELRALALTGIGLLYYQEGRVDDAEQSFLQATRANPRQSAAWENLAAIYLDHDDFAKAVGALERAHELQPDNREIALHLSKALQENGRSNQSSAMLKGFLQRHPDDAALWLELGKAESGQDSQAEAIYALDRAIAADPDNRLEVAAHAAELISNVRFGLEEWDQAVEAGQKAVSLAPARASAWEALGRAQVETGDSAAAIASLSRATELDAGSIQAHLDLASVYVKAKQLRSAEGIYLRALSIEPNSVEAAAGLEAARASLSTERAIVNGKTRPRKPIPPKKIGIEFADINYKSLELRGAVVKNINKKSPAARAGLRRGDLLLWIGSYEVLSDKDFFQYLKRNPPGDQFDVEYLRDGRIFQTKIQLR